MTSIDLTLQDLVRDQRQLVRGVMSMAQPPLLSPDAEDLRRVCRSDPAPRVMTMGQRGVGGHLLGPLLRACRPSERSQGWEGTRRPMQR
jgi:hypothetical protein